MASKRSICAGCLKEIKGMEYLNCCECKSGYDISCVNIPKSNFYLMDLDYKSTWKCPECCCKQQKTDNTNTPVRPTNSASSLRHSPVRKQPSSPKTLSTKNTTPDANVTQRKKSSQSRTVESKQEQWFSEGTLREIIKEELAAALKSSFRDLVANQLRNIQGEISEFKVSFEFFNEHFEEFKNRFHEKDTIIEQLRHDNENLQQSVTELTTRLSIVEQNMRDSNVEINGIPEDKSENLITTLKKIADVTSCDIGDNDIMQITRVAKLNKENNRPRTVVAKLRSPRQRDNLLAAVGVFNKKQSSDKLNSNHLGIAGNPVPIFVSEHLCPSSKQLHAATRKLAKELSYKFVWIRNGRILVRKDIYSKPIHIRSHESLKLMKITDVAI